jgi:formyl-CoA transferase
MQGNGSPTGPLEGLRVAEFAQVVAGPMAGGLLADMGADVVHVEPPGLGDPARKIGPAKDGAYLWFKVSGRNKRSVTCDLRRPEGQRIAHKLVEWADVVIVTFRAETLRQWGLDWPSIHRLNPRAVLLQISGYGANTTRANDPGFGKMGEARSGVVAITGMEGGPPLHTAFSHGDATTGLMGSWAVLAALWRRERDPEFDGEWIDLALFEPLYRLIEWQVIVYDQLHRTVGRTGNRMEFSPGAVQNSYQCADGQWLTVTSATPKTVQRIAVMLGFPAEEFQTQEQQEARRAELDAAVASWIAQRDATEAIETFDSFGVVTSPILTAADICEDATYRERADVIAVQDRDLGTVRMQAALPHLRCRPGSIWRTGPALGEDNRLVYGEWLGLPGDELDALAAEHVI